MIVHKQYLNIIMNIFYLNKNIFFYKQIIIYLNLYYIYLLGKFYFMESYKLFFLVNLNIQH